MHHEDSKGVTSRAVPRAPVIAAALLLLTGGAHAAAPWFGGETPSLAPMLEKVMPAVVNVATEGKVRMGRNPLLDDPLFRHFFDVPDEPRERKTQSLGSGVIVDAGRGLIITNAHVVANAEHIAVKLRNGRKLDAKRVGVDAETDVAVIQVPAEGLTALGFGDSDGLKVGDFVVAIGNPFGLDQTVTSGIVSALGRSGLGIEGYEEFIQTDASINPGNSGGALVDLQGRLIGINTAIFSQSGGSIGIGFAIPINAARQVMEQLAQHGEVKRGQLGVQLQDLDPDLAEAFDLNQQEGAVVVNVVEGSPAAKAGLKAGDVVVAVNGRPVRNASDLRNRVGLLRIGDKVTLEVLRKGLLGKNDRVADQRHRGGQDRPGDERLDASESAPRRRAFRGHPGALAGPWRGRGGHGLRGETGQPCLAERAAGGGHRVIRQSGPGLESERVPGPGQPRPIRRAPTRAAR